MKKILLLSVVASTMIMAGGDIAPVEPVVEAPAPAPAKADSGWDFGGQAVLYYQTRDSNKADLFDQEASRANAGVQLRATNKDIFAGIGAGVEVNGLATLGLQEDVVAGVMQSAGTADTRGGWISQAYLTYTAGNTNFKAGRQELPKSLSPFAFSENWNVFKNTFDALLVVNSDLPDTTLVGAVVAKNNVNGVGADMSQFKSTNPKDNGDDNFVYMLTAQNKSIDGLTLTGTGYYGPDMAKTDDITILWGDAKFDISEFAIALQGGTVMSDAFKNDTTAFGAKVGAKFGMFNTSLAYSSVDDGDTGVFNVGGVKTPLYTQLILNQNAIRRDADTVVAKVGANVLGGSLALAYDLTTSDSAEDYTEVDLTYKTKVFNDTTTLFAGYVYTQQDGVNDDDSQNMIRVWGRYNF